VLGLRKTKTCDLTLTANSYYDNDHRERNFDLRSFLRTSVIKTVASLHLDEVMLRRQRWRASRGGPLVLVVETHETLQRDAAQLRCQLEWVAERFTLISPETFFGLWDRKRTPPNWSKPAVLFTFDDGRESNYTVAAPMLESMGTRGLFFVVPEFVGLTAQKARDFYYSRIDPRGLTPSESPEQWTPMGPGQLADLTRRGHSIGNHTLSHVSLTGLSPSDRERQIVASAEQIASWTGKSVEAFAWPYSWNAIDREAWDLIRRTHCFCFSPCPGTADSSKDSPHLIWRTEIEAYYSRPQYGFMYSGFANPAWAGRRRRLQAMLRA
jgi:peptidoglycan/xylan/chitin deacetylase (PgdA/CDA1 family)